MTVFMVEGFSEFSAFFVGPRSLQAVGVMVHVRAKFSLFLPSDEVFVGLLLSG